MNKKITAVFPVMNRNQHVCETVPSWISCEEIAEIVLVDWSSRNPIHMDENFKNIYKNKKVKIIRIENEQYFLNPSFALNIGIDMSNGNNILKLDIDHKLINKNLLKILTRNSNPGHFFCGTVPRQEFNCYWGFSFFHRLDYEKIGGFNENFRGWGGEDADFYDRLEKAGNERTVVLNITDFIQHLDHNDELRVENHDIKDMNKSNYSNGLLSKNGLLFEKSKYNIININDNLVVLERIK